MDFRVRREEVMNQKNKNPRQVMRELDDTLTEMSSRYRVKMTQTGRYQVLDILQKETVYETIWLTELDCFCKGLILGSRTT